MDLQILISDYSDYIYSVIGTIKSIYPPNKYGDLSFLMMNCNLINLHIILLIISFIGNILMNIIILKILKFNGYKTSIFINPRELFYFIQIFKNQASLKKRRWLILIFVLYSFSIISFFIFGFLIFDKYLN